CQALIKSNNPQRKLGFLLLWNMENPYSSMGTHRRCVTCDQIVGNDLEQRLRWPRRGEYQDDTSIVGNCQPFCFVCSLSVSVSTE
ncbi:hypothetical protein, partial [Budvicia aquatica]|uniref:hypothetical protein n=1 Tax=Budvicia aquatica TaxID=82979 RepID=UPI001B7FB437